MLGSWLGRLLEGVMIMVLETIAGGLMGGLFRLAPENKNFQPVTFSQVSFQRKVIDVWIGVEHQRYFNKNGVKGLDESVNQLIIKWEF